MSDLYFNVDTALAEVPVNIFPLTDDTDFKTIETAVVYNAAGMALRWNFVTAAGSFFSVPVTPTTAGNYDWTHQGGGMYTIEIPASGGADINNDLEGYGWFTGVATGVLPWRGPIITFRPAVLNDSLINGTDYLQTDVIQFGGTNATFAVAGRPNVNAAYFGGVYLDAGTTGAIDALGIIDRGTAQAVTSSSITLRSGSTFNSDLILGSVIKISGATVGTGQTRVISDYDSGTQVATVSPAWTNTPTGTITYTIHAAPPAPTALPMPANVVQFGGADAVASGGRPEVNTTHFGGTAGSFTVPGRPGVNTNYLADTYLAPGSTGGIDALGIIDRGTAQAASASTITLRSGSVFNTDLIVGCIIRITGATTGNNQVRAITAYNSSTQVATVSPDWSVSLTGTITYTIYAAAYPSTNPVPANVTQYNGVAAVSTGGRPEVNATHIAGSIVDPNAAQIGTNVVNAGGTAIDATAGRLNVNVADMDIDVITSDALAASAVAEINAGGGGSGLTQADVRAALGMASANLDAQLSAIVTDTGTDIPATLSTIAANIASVLTDTGTDIPALIAALNDVTVTDILTTQMTESYAANGTAPTLAQALFAIHQHMMDFAISGTTRTVRRLDSVTTAFTETLNSSTNATSLTR